MLRKSRAVTPVTLPSCLQIRSRADEALSQTQIREAAKAVVLGLEEPIGILEGMGVQHRNDRCNLGRSGSETRDRSVLPGLVGKCLAHGR